MPIFKFSDPTLNQINGDLSLHYLEIAGTMGAYGSLTLHLLRIAGKMQDVINGEVRLLNLKIDGEIGVSAKINGVLSLPILTISGDMQAECSIALHALRIDGVVRSQGVVAGSLFLPALQVGGNVSVLGVVSGSIKLPLMQISGAFVQDASAIIGGAVTIPALRIEGALVYMDGHDYGSETDVALRYDAARRHI